MTLIDAVNSPDTKLKVVAPPDTIVPVKLPSSFFSIVAIASSLDVAVVAEITSFASEASAGTAEMVNDFVSPTLAVQVF